jgi:hypothetical protein
MTTARHLSLSTSNAFSTTLDGNVALGDDSILLTTVTGLQAPGLLCIDRTNGSTSTPNLREYIFFSGISTRTLTGVLRGLGGSTAQPHSSGALVEEIITTDHWNDLLASIAVGHNSNGTHKAFTILHDIQTSEPAVGGTATLDLSLGNLHSITMPAGNITIAIANETAGQIFSIEIVQDAVGSRTITWFSTIRWADGNAPTLTTTGSKKDIFTFICTGTDAYDAFVAGQNI